MLFPVKFWLFLGVFVLYWLSSPLSGVWPKVVYEDHPELECQAEAWLHGHGYLPEACINRVGEKFSWPVGSQHFYIVHPPGAAAMMLPAQLLGLNAVVVSCLVGAACVTLCYGLTSSWWVTVLFALGTNFWYEASGGRPWGFTLIAACLPTFLLLRSTSDLTRGFWLGMGALCRYDIIGATPALFKQLKRGRFLLGLTPALLLYFLNAHLKFGGWWDISLWQWYRHGGSVMSIDNDVMAPDHYGPFSLHYLPYSIYTALFMGPGFSATFPWIRPITLGQSLLTTSPGLLLALRTPCRKAKTLRLWLAVCGVMSGAMLVWSNGYVQFGDRYWIMALPFLMALIAETPIDQFAKILITASVGLNAYGVWYIRSGYPF